MKITDKFYYYWLAILTIFIIHVVYLNSVAEDAFITFRFAKNLVHGHGLTWNIGEPPVEGYTNFLWVVICALVLELRYDVLLFSQIIGVLASLATLIYTYKFAYKLLDCQTIYSLIPCLFLAISGPFATWAGSGMETNVFGLFLVIGCYYFTSYWQFNSRRELLLCFIALLLATLTRPEGFMVFAILVSLGWVIAAEGLRTSIKDFLFPALLYIVSFSIYFAWRLKYYGFLLPNTFYAKTGGTVYQYLRGAIYSGFFAAYFIFPLCFLPVLFVWEKGCPMTIRQVNFRLIRLHIKSYVGVYVCGVICVMYTLYITYVGGDYMAMYRFFVPILPFIYILFGLIVNSLFSSISDSSRKMVIAKGVLIFAVVATVLHSTPLETKLFRKPSLQHGTYRGVQTERWHSARLSLIGKFFNKYKRSYNESLATDAIGAISYYADMKIYDLNGLVDTYIAHKKMNNRVPGLKMAGHGKEDLVYTFSKKPTYFMLERRFSQKPRNYPNYLNYPDHLNGFIEENYKLTAVWLIDQENCEKGYFTFLELKQHHE